jgi:carotenoid isomerooxygenase
MISIYPFNDEYFTFTESPIIHKVDVESLDTVERLNLHEKYGFVNQTSHPHVIPDGTVYNVGMILSLTGPAYAIICFPHGENIFQDAHVVAKVPVRWKLHPSYMHTFGITENYFIIVEQPMTVSVPAMVKSKVYNEPIISCLKWFSEEMTYIHVVDRKSGELFQTFKTETFFFMHIINQYEKDGHLIIDISCYKDPEMLNCMYVESIKNLQSNPDYAKLIRGRPLRFVLPLDSKNFKENLITLKDTLATAHQMPDGSTFCNPELICDMGCEVPRINYEKYLGNEYRYFYAVSSDIDAENPNSIIKVDTLNKSSLIWFEKNVCPSEPIFVPSPNSKSEDDGVILASMLWVGEKYENKVGLLVLDAKTMKELARCEFSDLPGPIPKCLHGWFADKN